MAGQVEGGAPRGQIHGLLGMLAGAGLLRDVGQATYEMHPVLSGYLRTKLKAEPARREAWTRAFVDVMGRLADQLAPLHLHEQRGGFHLHGANFHHALAEAERLGMDTHVAALTRALGAHAQNTRNFKAAAHLFAGLAAHGRDHGKLEWEAPAYHQLGRIAEEQRDFASAQQWYLKSLDISEKQGNQHGAAITYHQLGRIAQEQRDFASAQQWYLKSLDISEKQGNPHCAASTYHQLGRIAEEQRDFAAAQQWYLKSLAIEEKQGNPHGAAISYHQLGIIAQQQRDFAAAQQWYLKSLAIEEKQGNQHGAAISYGQLGILAGLQEQFEDAGRWLIKCILSFTRTHDPHDAERNLRNFLICYRRAPPAAQATLRQMWTEANLGPWPESPGFEPAG